MHNSRRITRITLRFIATGIAVAVMVACGSNPPPVAPPSGPDPAAPSGGGVSPGRVTPPDPGLPPLPPVDDAPAITARSFDGLTPTEINAESPLQPVFFNYDSDQLDDVARGVLSTNADVLRDYPSWVITIEGHCDERGTPEYNLALGDRRALAAKTYLQSLGISANRLHTVSYGKEFPFDPGHDDAAWAQNRRAHLMVTSTQ